MAGGTGTLIITYVHNVSYEPFTPQLLNTYTGQSRTIHLSSFKCEDLKIAVFLSSDEISTHHIQNEGTSDLTCSSIFHGWLLTAIQYARTTPQLLRLDDYVLLQRNKLPPLPNALVDLEDTSETSHHVRKTRVIKKPKQSAADMKEHDNATNSNSSTQETTLASPPIEVTAETTDTCVDLKSSYIDQEVKEVVMDICAVVEVTSESNQVHSDEKNNVAITEKPSEAFVTKPSESFVTKRSEDEIAAVYLEENISETDVQDDDYEQPDRNMNSDNGQDLEKIVQAAEEDNNTSNCLQEQNAPLTSVGDPTALPSVDSSITHTTSETSTDTSNVIPSDSVNVDILHEAVSFARIKEVTTTLTLTKPIANTECELYPKETPTEAIHLRQEHTANYTAYSDISDNEPLDLSQSSKSTQVESTKFPSRNSTLNNSFTSANTNVKMTYSKPTAITYSKCSRSDSNQYVRKQNIVKAYIDQETKWVEGLGFEHLNISQLQHQKSEDTPGHDFDSKKGPSAPIPTASPNIIYPVSKKSQDIPCETSHVDMSDDKSQVTFSSTDEQQSKESSPHHDVEGKDKTHTNTTSNLSGKEKQQSELNTADVVTAESGAASKSLSVSQLHLSLKPSNAVIRDSEKNHDLPHYNPDYIQLARANLERQKVIPVDDPEKELDDYVDLCNSPFIPHLKLHSKFPKDFNAKKLLDRYKICNGSNTDTEYTFPDDMKDIKRLLLSIAILEEKKVLHSIVKFATDPSNFATVRNMDIAQAMQFGRNYGKYVTVYLKTFLLRQHFTVHVTSDDVLTIKKLTMMELVKMVPKHMCQKRTKILNMGNERSSKKVKSTTLSKDFIDIQTPTDHDLDESFTDMLNANGLKDSDLQQLMNTSMMDGLLPKEVTTGNDLVEKLTSNEDFSTIDMVQLSKISEPQKSTDVSDVLLKTTSNSASENNSQSLSIRPLNQSDAIVQEMSHDANALKSELRLDSVFAPELVRKHLSVCEIENYIDILTKRLHIMRYLHRKRTGLRKYNENEKTLMTAPHPVIDVLTEEDKVQNSKKCNEEFIEGKSIGKEEELEKSFSVIVPKKDENLEKFSEESQGSQKLSSTVDDDNYLSDIPEIKSFGTSKEISLSKKQNSGDMCENNVQEEVHLLNSSKKKKYKRKTISLGVTSTSGKKTKLVETEKQSTITADDFLEVFAKRKPLDDISNTKDDLPDDKNEDMSVEQSISIINRARKTVNEDIAAEDSYSFVDRKNLRMMAGNCKSISRRRKKEKVKTGHIGRRGKSIRLRNYQSNMMHIKKEMQKNKERKKKKEEEELSCCESSSESESDLGTSESPPLKKKKVQGEMKKMAADLDLIALKWEEGMEKDAKNEHESSGKEDEEENNTNSDFAENEFEEDDYNWKEDYYKDQSSESDLNSSQEDNQRQQDIIKENESVDEDDEEDKSDSEKGAEEEEQYEVSVAEQVKKSGRDNRRRNVRVRAKSAFDPSYTVPEEITVDYYGCLRLPVELRCFDYDRDVTSYNPVTGWDRIDDFRYLFCLSVEPKLSRCKSGRWIRFALIMKALGSKKTNQNCSDHQMTNRLDSLFKYKTIMGHYYKLSKATGEATQDDPLKRKILQVCSVNKHFHPDIAASSDGGIKERVRKPEEERANNAREHEYLNSKFPCPETKKRRKVRKKETRKSFMLGVDDNEADDIPKPTKNPRGKRKEKDPDDIPNVEGVNFQKWWMQYCVHRDRVQDKKDEDFNKLVATIFAQGTSRKDENK